jgi:CBS domain-containing protein
MFVKQILDTKGCEVWTIPNDATVFEALELMADKEIGALLVMDKKAPVGIFSERDYARQVALKGKSSQEIPVRDVMHSKVMYVQPDQTLEDCMALMTMKHIRHLPVMENDELTGLISIGDVVKAMIDEKEFMIEQLVKYVQSGW